MIRQIKLGSFLSVRQSGQSLLSCGIQGKTLLNPGSCEEDGRGCFRAPQKELESPLPPGNHLSTFRGETQLTAESRIHGRHVHDPAEQEKCTALIPWQELALHSWKITSWQCWCPEGVYGINWGPATFQTGVWVWVSSRETSRSNPGGQVGMWFVRSGDTIEGKFAPY